MNKRVFLVIILFLCCFSLWADEHSKDSAAKTTFEEYPNAIGFFATSDAGAGLSYQRWGNKIGFSVMAGLVYYPDDLYFSRSLDYSVYLEAAFPLFGQDLTSWLSGIVYLFGGGFHGGYILQEWVDDDMDYTTEPVKVSGPFTPYIGVSAGIGIEAVLFRHFSSSLEMGYAPIWRYNPYKFFVPFMIQGGFRFRF
jgi:hypothetical protein